MELGVKKVEDEVNLIDCTTSTAPLIADLVLQNESLEQSEREKLTE